VRRDLDVKLPNSDRAVVDIKKLRDYSLNLNYPKGKHKARVFLSALGLKAEDTERLREMIMEAILISEARVQQPTSYGQRFVVDFDVIGFDKFITTTVTLRSAWIIRIGEDFPRLTSCFIL
jgi:CRISPR/Cas system type I-B associated protein Csh2 (Cas7 group RAMP superfamily)